MTHRAFSFSIGDQTAVLVAVALVAPTARYAGIHTIGAAGRAVTRVASSEQWRAMDAELNPTPSGLIEPGSLLRRLILGGEERSLEVRFIQWADLAVPESGQIAAELDAHLRALARAAG